MARAATVQETRVEDLSLFAWAQQEAARIEAARAEQVKRIEALNDATLVLESSPTWVALEKARAALKDARAAALEEDVVVAEAKQAVKEAKKRTKGLKALLDARDAKAAAKLGESGIRQAEAGLATALSKGEAPAPARETESVDSRGETTVSLSAGGVTTGPMPLKEFKRRVSAAIKREVAGS